MSQIILDATGLYSLVAVWIFFEQYELFVNYHIWTAFGVGILLAIVAYNIASAISIKKRIG